MANDYTLALCTVHTFVNLPATECWQIWTDPSHILKFNNPFDDWHTAKVELDLKAGGRYYYRMEKKDNSEGFDFAGIYVRVVINSLIECRGDDGRTTTNSFETKRGGTLITETFEPDATTPVQLQKQFCKNILDSLKVYAERITQK